MAKDLLIEIGCEELPPKALDKALSAPFFAGVMQGLKQAKLEFDEARSERFYTARRLAMRIASVAAKQPDQVLERRGPAVSAAFNEDGKPTPAALGFARSLGKTVDELERLETDKGSWLFCKVEQPGKPLSALIYPIIEQALKQLPIPKPMRWGDNDFSFVRPVHWLVVMHAEEVLPGTLFGLEAGNHTRGHRVHAPGFHEVPDAKSYESALENAFVLVTDERKKRIRRTAAEAGLAISGETQINGALLDEVNNLLEWPVAITCSFDKDFLSVPQEALIASMESHQKFFPILENEHSKKLTNHFVAFANLESENPDAVREGFERVVTPRLADARFFWEQDKKIPLSERLPALDGIVFQKQLGTVGDKTRRVIDLSEKLAESLGLDPSSPMRAASLSKCDLVTDMVGEFPELQGAMGRYYALAHNETEEVAYAIEQHYWPRFAGDHIPETSSGQVVALADKLDTIVGIFASGQKPSGNRDPFALRRNALGVARILKQARLDLSLGAIIQAAAEAFPQLAPEPATLVTEVKAFVLDRLRYWYRDDRGFSTELFNAVVDVQSEQLADFDDRISALDEFMQHEEAQTLAAANKRISNIIKKADPEDLDGKAEIKPTMEAEADLYDQLRSSQQAIQPLCQAGDYAGALDRLARLKPAVDRFFDQVMVMDDDAAVRRSRLALLNQVRQAFRNIANISAVG